MRSPLILVPRYRGLVLTDGGVLVPESGANACSMLMGNGNGVDFGGAPQWTPASYAIEALLPVSTLPTTVAVRKGYCDGTNRHRYYMLTPISADGITAQLWDMTTEGSPSPYTTGMIRLVRSQVVYIWDTTHYSIAYDGAGRSGAWAAVVTGATYGWAQGLVYTVGASAEEVVYTVVVPEGGGIGWEWLGITNCGIAWVVVKDDGGTEVAGGYYDIADVGGHREIDTYRVAGPTSPTIIATRIAHGLPAGTYTLTVTASGTKNGSSSGYRIYDRGADALDLSAAGDYAADPWFYESSLQSLIGYSALTIGNQEYASYLKQAGHAVGELAYCGGTHGNESAAASVSILVDGVDRAATLKATGTAWGTGFSGTTIVMSHTTTGITQTGSVNWATLAHQHTWTRAGMDYTLTRTVLADVDVQQEYVAMLLCVNATLGGPPNVRMHEKPTPIKHTDGTATPGVQTQYTPGFHNGGVFYSDTFAAAIDAPIALASVYPTIAHENAPRLLTFNTDATEKNYCAWTIMTSGYYRTLTAGDVKTVTTHYRAVYVPGGGVIAAVDGA